MFLLGQKKPDYDFLEKSCGIHNLDELKKAVNERLKIIDPKVKRRDFEHLLFNKANSEKILRFGSLIAALKE